MTESPDDVPVRRFARDLFRGDDGAPDRQPARGVAPDAETEMRQYVTDLFGRSTP